MSGPRMSSTLLSGLVPVGLLLTACAPDQPDTVLVELTDHAFSQAAVTVPVGTEVRWVNRGSTSHTVTSDEWPGDTEYDTVLYPGDVAAYRFDEPGSYLYWCRHHVDDQMVGTVTVVER